MSTMETFKNYVPLITNLQHAGVSKMMPLQQNDFILCLAGHDQQLILARGMIIYYALLNISTDFLEVIALYLKGNHSSSPHAWVTKADSISNVSRTLVEIFCFDDIKHDSIIFHKFWPHSSLHNAHKYQLLPSTLILCFIGSGSIMSDYDVDVPVYRLTGIHANISVSIINTSVVIKAAVNMLEKGSRGKS